MRYYLVDYENVNATGLDGLNKLTENDKVCIFYTEKANTLTFGLHRRLNETKAEVMYQKVEAGTKNALDFQLASFLGYLIKEYEMNFDKKDIRFYIVSKDNGYSTLVNYWQKKNIDIAMAINLVGKSEEHETNETILAVKELIPFPDDAEIVAKLLLKYKTKLGFHNALVTQLPSQNNKKASEIYKSLKPLLSDKKGN